MADGQVVFEITGDSRGINQTVKQVTSNIQSESKKWDQAAGQATGGIEKQFSDMAKSIVTKLTVAGISSALLKFGSDAIEAASDLSEVQNVVDTVFGDGARTIDNWAKKAGEQFGLTETKAKKFTSTLGAMMKSSGLAGNEIVKMSTDLSGLAADMASFYNLDFDTAFEKIRSGISGETMPLKQLGINMSVANLEAFALAQGLEKTFSEMDQGEQTMLRYQYLMKATADAQGDFAKTSDGFANAQRRIQASIDSIKTSVGQVLLPVIESAVGGIASFLSSISAGMMPEKTVLDEFNEIDVDTETKLADIQATYDSASDLIKILKEIEQETVTLKDGSTVSLTSLFGDIAEIEKSGGDIQEYISGLGLDVDYVVLEYNKWKEATRQLTSLVPSLSSAINSETGAIDGGTEALQRNLDEWKKNEENKVYWAQYYAKAEAVARAKGEQAGNQITARAKQLAADRARKAVEGQAATLGVDLEYYEGHVDWSKYSGQRNTLTEEQRNYNDAVDEYIRIQGEADQATKKAEQSSNDLADAEALLADELAATEEITGETLESVQQLKKANEDAGEAAGEWSEEQKKAGKEAVQAADEAIKALADYIKGVRDATEQTVNSSVKGFEKVGLAGDDLRKKQEELGDEYVKTTKEHEAAVKSLQKRYGTDFLQKASDNYDSLTDAEKEAYNALAKLRNEQDEVNKSLNEYRPEGMMSNLQDQITFMEEYLKNLETLSEWGVSSEMLASLSDGSKESAEYLAGLASGGEEAAKSVGELYDQVQEKKQGFVDSLTQQKLAADDVYDGLVDTALSAIEELNLGEEAESAMADTIQGLAQGIADNVSGVQSAVDSIVAQLDRLNGLGFGFNLGGLEFGFHLDGEHETGLDYVPFDGYLAGLHQGEGILTAEENRIWQRFKNGQHSGVDYDALGGVMRDNISAGGNVYLDGRTVGKVVSGMQGNQYRSMQRSGFQ